MTASYHGTSPRTDATYGQQRFDGHADPGPVCTDLERLLSRGDIRCVYQPIVDLRSGSVIGHEAAARGPFGSCLEQPEQLYAAARAQGHLGELHRACRTAAVEGASLAATLRTPRTLFIKTGWETAWDAFQTDGLIDVRGLPARPWDRRFQIVIQLNQQALTSDRLQLLLLVARIRSHGWGIELDDLRSDPNSLALLPVLRPDVIKLDPQLVRQRCTAETTVIITAVNAEAERSGTLILAAGIETETHQRIALSLGATLGQGWLLGRPEVLPNPLPCFGTHPSDDPTTHTIAVDNPIQGGGGPA